MWNTRVYPTNSSKNSNTERLVETIDLELQQITNSTDDFINNLYLDTDLALNKFNNPPANIINLSNTLNDVAKKTISSAGAGNDQTKTSRPHREPLIKGSSISAVVPFQENGIDSGFQLHNSHSTDDDVEEIKLSHDIPANQKDHEINLIENLKSKFMALQEQVDQYQSLCKVTFEKLKESETKNFELECRIDDLDDEKLQLIHQLKQQEQANTPGLNNVPLNFVLNPNFNRNVGNQLKHHTNQDLRKALLLGMEDTDESNSMASHLLVSNKNLIFRQVLHRLQSFLTPFRRDIRQIHSRYGSSVASYFTFYRFMFVLMLLIGGIMTGFLVWHVINLCELLSWIDFLGFTSYVPYIMSVSSFSTSEGLLYDLAIISVLVIFLVALTWKLVFEDRLAKDMTALEAENRIPYSKDVLAVWDFSAASKQEVVDFQTSMSNKYLLAFEASRVSGLKKTRTQWALVVMYARRILGFLLYFTVVAASFAVIIYVTINSSKISNRVENIPVLNKLEALVVPFILNFINGILPIILKGITVLEGWDSAETISNIILFRMYLSSILNALLIAFSYLILTDPGLLSDSLELRNSLGVEADLGKFPCRFDQAAAGLFNLVIFTWALDNISFWMAPFGNYVIARIRKKPFIKSEFGVAENMVKRLNFMGLLFISLPYCPLTWIFTPLYLGIGFKWEKNIIKYYYSKPKRQWNGQRAGLFYTLFFLLTFASLGLVVTSYFFTSKTFVKLDNDCPLKPTTECGNACGPFTVESTNLTPFQTAISAYSALYIAWQICFSYPYLPWFGIIMLSLLLSMKENSLLIDRLASQGKLNALEGQIAAIEIERKKQDKMIRKLKAIESSGFVEESKDEFLNKSFDIVKDKIA